MLFFIHCVSIYLQIDIVELGALHYELSHMDTIFYLFIF